MAGEFVKEGTDASFVKDVIEPSQETLVLVDFWAPWCGPCRTLGPTIERVVNSFKGAVKLVKINVDQNPHFSGQLRVQSIPAVFAFKNGQPVDGFMGALPESQINAFIEKHVGAPKSGGVEQLLAAAEESLKMGEIGGAAQSFAQVLEIDADNQIALVGMANCYIHAGQIDEAEALVPKITDAAEKNSLSAQIMLIRECQNARDVELVTKDEVAKPDDLAIKYELAQSLVKIGDFEGAIDKLFEILKSELDWNGKAARMFLLKIFDALGNSSEITRFGRRRLSTLLFS